MCIANVVRRERGASRTWCVVPCPEGAVANSRWEASGFMLAHPPDQRARNPPRQGRWNLNTKPRATRQWHHAAAPAGAETLGVRIPVGSEHEPARFPPAI